MPEKTVFKVIVIAAVAAIFVSITAPASVSAQTPNTAWYSSSASAFTLSNANQLAGLAQLVNGGNSFAGKTVTLDSDISLSAYGASYNSGKGWTPVGNAGAASFSGVFNGGGKTVSGLFINAPNDLYVGLFGNVTGAGRVENLRVAEASVTGRGMVGGVAGQLWGGGSVVNCSFSGAVSGNYSMVGGVVGYADSGRVVNSSSAGTVSLAVSANSGGGAGGVAGWMTDSSGMTGCHSSSAVSGGDWVGGVAGHVERSSIANSYGTGAVSGRNEVGGVAGSLVNGSRATNCYSTGAVSGGFAVGGIVGTVNRSRAASCAALNSEVKANSAAGAGRVAGNLVGAGGGGNDTLSSNIAYDEMKNSDGGVAWNNKGANARDGADITVSGIHADGKIGGLFANADVWTVAPGKLPGLSGSAVDMPAHLKTLFFTLRYSAGAGGRLMGASTQSVEPGASGTTVVAIANDGYKFTSWSDGVTTAERTDKDVKADITVTANFTPAQYTLRYTAGAGGKITGSAQQTVAPGASGEAVTAVADSGYVFVSWSDSVKTAERTDKDVKADITVTANFARIQHTLRYILGVGGKEFLGGGAEQRVNTGANGEEIYAVANTGYTFARWSDGSTDNPRIDRNVQGDKTVTAYFADSDGNVSVQSPARVAPAMGAPFVRITGSTLKVGLPARGKVEIYALTGAKVRKLDVGQGVHALRLNGLPRGTYVVSAESGAWRQSVRMVVR